MAAFGPLPLSHYLPVHQLRILIQALLSLLPPIGIQHAGKMCNGQPMTGPTGDLCHEKEPTSDTVNDILLYSKTEAQHNGPLKGFTQQLMKVDAEMLGESYGKGEYGLTELEASNIPQETKMKQQQQQQTLQSKLTWPRGGSQRLKCQWRECM